MEEEKIIEERKKKLLGFFKGHYNYVTYALLALVTFMAVYIRTRNLPGLRDITTGGWTLGPDLDPFLFLRWAKYIVANGTLFAIDTMRYAPLGYDVRGEFVLLSYLIAWFHKVATFFGSVSVDQSAVFYPVFMFALTVIAFFFLVREVFIDDFGPSKSNLIGLIASFFLSVLPPLLPRTIAGIPEKESTAFLFLFLGFYFFLKAWKSKTNLSRYGFAILSALSTVAMGLIWGGVTYLYATMAVSIFIAFLLGQVDREKFYIYSIWLVISLYTPSLFSNRYTFVNVVTSTITGAAIGIFAVIAFHLFIFKYLEKYIENTLLSKIPKPLLSAILATIVGLITGVLFFGIGFVTSNIQDILTNLVRPVVDRLGVTVAENRQPYFNEWSSNFGPTVKGIPIYFWLFFIGSVYLFYYAAKKVFEKREQIIMTVSYTVFLVALIFSRYSPNSIMNGTSWQSLLVYALGFIALLGTFGAYYFKYNKKGEFEKFKQIDLSLILIFIFFFLAIVSARGGIRVIMVLVPPSAVLVAYLLIHSFNYAKKSNKSFAWIISAILLLSAVYSGYYLYQVSASTAAGYVPNSYTQQWQKAMAWVRDNTPENAVFGHWWDYGYWVQSIGERATVLDGGNAMGNWNYAMGRYALSGTDEMVALEFLYAHNTTHFLIDSTDIGKYSAFSSIGSNENYDRTSYIPSFALNNQQMQETKNSTISLYQGGAGLDEDIVYVNNGTRIFLPSGKAGLGGILVEKDKSGDIISQPIGIFVYQNQRYEIPFRYAYDKKFIDFGSGIESGIFLMPSLTSGTGGQQLAKDGVLLYLSNRTAKSQLARLYLYNNNDPYFKLVHSEDDFVVAQLKQRNLSNADFVYDGIYGGGVRGPIRIWEINYPKGISFNSEFLRTDNQDFLEKI